MVLDTTNIGAISKHIVANHKLLNIADGRRYHFGILKSAWMRTSDRLKSDYNYSNISWPQIPLNPPFTKREAAEARASIPPFANKEAAEARASIPPFANKEAAEARASIPPFANKEAAEARASIPPFVKGGLGGILPAAQAILDTRALYHSLNERGCSLVAAKKARKK
jgi:hypothetical protein